jgi:tetratricopeptide (TPR) repeat protein
MASAGEKTEKTTVSESIAFFIQKYRRTIITIAVVVVVVVAGVIAGLAIRDYMGERALSAFEGFNDRYETLRIDINDPSKTADVSALTEELSVFAAKTGGFPGARAYDLLASIEADKKNWAAAEEYWTLAAGKGGKTYLVPVALFNAAVSAEEQGEIERALEHYTASLGYADVFPGAPRAQFAIGRLREEQQNRDAALEAYRGIIEKWPASVWTNWANSRIIVLTGSVRE